MNNRLPLVASGIGLLALGAGAWFVLGRGAGPSTTDGAAQTDAGNTDAGTTDAVASEPTGGDHPNVLIVMWDTVRADRMSLYGHDRPTTPRLDAFATEAVVYDNATAPGMWTLPTHASMFTGVWPETHGARAVQSQRWLDSCHDTLAEILSGAGYDTMMASTNLVASPMTNLHQGFETVHTTYPRKGEGKGRKAKAVKPGKYSKAAKAATRAKIIPRDASTEISPSFAGNDSDKWAKSVYKDAAPVLHKGLVEFIEGRAPGTPWFAYLNMMEAHSPRIPSMSARERLLTPEQIELGLTTDASLSALNEYIVGQRRYTDAELQAIAGVYDASILDLDDATGDLFDDLRARGVLDDTIVVVVADHGEALGEHQMFEHRWSVFEQLLHVPLIIRYPEGMKPARVSDRVTTMDVFSTILDLTGVPPTTVPVASRSLRSNATRRHVFAQLLDPFEEQMGELVAAYPSLDLSPWKRTYQVAYEGALKRVEASDGVTQLFHVHDDPEELADRYAAEVAKADALGKVLNDWREALPRPSRDCRAAGEGPKRPSVDDKAMLCELGYADCDEEGE